LLPIASDVPKTAPSATSALALIRDRACASPAEVTYLLAQGESSEVVSEDARALTLAVGALRPVPVFPGGALVQERTPAGVKPAPGVQLLPLDPQWQIPLPSACAQRALGEATTNAAGVAPLLLPVFPSSEGALSFRYVSSRGIGQVDVPAPSAISLSNNLHRITLEVSDLGLAQVEASREPVREFGAGFFAKLTGPLDASRICRGTSLLGVAGTATCDAPPPPKPCVEDGQVGCVTTPSHKAAAIGGLASKVLSTSSVAGEKGTVVLPSLSDVRSGVTFGTASASSGTYTPDFPNVANVRASDTVNGASGTLGDCTADGSQGCVVPSSGSIRAADTANFTGWDIRRKRNSAGALVTFAGLTGQTKTCRNRANTAVFNNTTAPSSAGLDFFDTIDDANNNLTGLPGEIPEWTMLIGGNTVTVGSDFACGGIYATGNTATGNTGADATLAHDANGNWQDLTPGIIPAATPTNSTNTANGCNAADKHCVFRELISGLMVTEVSAATYTWQNAINYCHNLGEAGGAVTSPIPFIGGASHSDWRLPTQKELMQLYSAGVRGLNQTSNLITFFGDVDTNFWSSSSVTYFTSDAWDVDLSSGDMGNLAKTDTRRAVCVR
jgi:hypothetical protein